MRHHHAIDSSRRRRCRSIQVRIAIKPQQINVLVITPRAGQQPNDLRAIPAQHHNQRAALHRNFRARLQIIESSNNFLKVACAAMLVVVRKEPGRAIAVVYDLKTGSLQPLH